ncbi:MAG: amino acid permease [Candidatus Acidiferrales bacterium]
MEQKAAQLRRELTAGQMAMVAVGGAIGTGLLLGSGAAVQTAGPAIILTFVLGAFVAFSVGMALGEMSSLHPAAGAFGIYAEMYLSQWAGFVSRYGYWFCLLMATGADLVASGIYMRYWFPRVPVLAWVAGFAAVLLFVNFLDVHNFGRFESWFAMIKVVVIVAFILIGAALLFGGKAPANYTTNGGFLPRGAAGPVLALAFVLFNFQGTESVSICSGEARSPRDIVRATFLTVIALTFIYVCASAVLVGIVPWNAVGVTESPFVTVFQVAHIPAISAIMNFVVLTAALSGANALLYVSSRMLYSLAESGYAHPTLAKLSSTGSPRNALLVSTVAIVAALVAQYIIPKDAFLFLFGASLVGGMLAWCIALASHVAMRRKLSPAEIAALPMRAPGGAPMSMVAIALIVVATGATWWVPPLRVTIIGAAPLILLLTVFYFYSAARKKGSREKIEKVPA